MLVKLSLLSAIISVISSGAPDMAQPLTSNNQSSGSCFKSLISANFSTFKDSYENYYGTRWAYGTPIDSKPIVDDDAKKIGSVVLFEDGYMSISNDSQILDEPHFGEPCMWNSTINYTYKFGRVGVTNANHFIGTDGNVYADLDVSAYSSSDLSSYFHPFQNLKPANHKNTRIDYALCPFTIFKNDWGYEPSEYERWSAYCTQQDSGVCMISAVVNLLLTYKYSTRHDCTNGLKPESLYNEVAKGCVTGDKGALELTFAVDVNKYLNKTSSGCYLNAGTPGVLVPYIANYHLHGDMVNGHTVMVIGRASSDYWWIFKTYWDIVLTWERNYDTKTMALDYENYTSIYYVDHQYQTGGYQLCKNQLTVTKDN